MAAGMRLRSNAAAGRLAVGVKARQRRLGGLSGPFDSAARPGNLLIEGLRHLTTEPWAHAPKQRLRRKRSGSLAIAFKLHTYIRFHCPQRRHRACRPPEALGSTTRAAC